MSDAFTSGRSWSVWGLATLCASLLSACGGSDLPTTAAPEIRDGTLVASGSQRTLYKFDTDVLNSGKSVCNNACATRWPPLQAQTGDMPTGEYTIITRDDGTLQWAASGKPLYYFMDDTRAGDQLGENVGNVWHVATPATTGTSGVNGVLVGSGKSARPSFTLYTFDRDVANSGKSVCNNTATSTCATTWPPLLANAADKANGIYTIITRDDGSLQWAANGKPLYFYTPDLKIGDQLGDNVGTVWHVATTFTTGASVVKGNLVGSGKSARPSFTLYTFDRDVANSGKSVCNNTATSTCATTWPPLIATADDKAYGAYTIITRDDGSLQWAANGKPLYFYTPDLKIGDQLGDNVGTVWHVAKKI